VVQQVLVVKPNSNAVSYLKNKSSTNTYKVFEDYKTLAVELKAQTSLGFNIIVTGFPVGYETLYDILWGNGRNTDRNSVFLFQSGNIESATLDKWNELGVIVENRSLAKYISKNYAPELRLDKTSNKELFESVHTKAYKAIEKNIESECQFTLIRGFSGTGKSTLINLAQSKGLLSNVLTIETKKNIDDFIAILLKKLNIEQFSVESDSSYNQNNVLKTVKNHLNKIGEVTLIFDKVENIVETKTAKINNQFSAFFTQLLLLVNELPRVKVYLLSKTNIIFDDEIKDDLDIANIQLHPFSKKETVQLLKFYYQKQQRSQLVTSNDDDIMDFATIDLDKHAETIHELTGGIPYLIVDFYNESQEYSLDYYLQNNSDDQTYNKKRNLYVNKNLNLVDEELHLLRFLAIFDTYFEASAIGEFYPEPLKIIKNFSNRSILQIIPNFTNRTYQLPIAIKNTILDEMDDTKIQYYKDRVIRYRNQFKKND
jgi:hypothetical protein